MADTTEVISKVTVGGVESRQTQSGVGRVGTNSLGSGMSCKVLTTFETSSTVRFAPGGPIPSHPADRLGVVAPDTGPNARLS